MRIIEVMETEAPSGRGKTLWFLGVFFLVLNLSARTGVLWAGTSGVILSLGLAGILFCLVPIFRPSLLPAVLFCFAVTFPLYGSFPYSTHAFLFDLYVSFLSLTLIVNLYKNGSYVRGCRPVRNFLFLYVLFSCGSLLLLPVRNIGWQLLLWDWDDFWNAVFFATPELPLYAVAAMNRLILYTLFAVLLASCREARTLYRAIFAGLLAAVFWSSVTGIIDHYNLVDLQWFRAEHKDHWNRLQSVFANPGWFAEFVAVCAPYILTAFLGPHLNRVKMAGLFGLAAVGQLAVILTYSRAGWVIYPFILCCCWLMYYIARNTGRIKWRRVAGGFSLALAAVILTVGVGYFLLFHVFASKHPHAEGDKRMFHQRISQLTDPSVRKVIWEETVDLVGMKPLFGLGYETFKQHNSILNRVRKQWDTPHNLYLQLLVSGGAAGLILWASLIASALYFLIADLARNRNYENIQVILSIAAFHLYGFAQSMQYIPMIWFLIFLNIGYALTIPEIVAPERLLRSQAVLARMLFLVVLAGVVVYAADFQSGKLAEQGKLKIYARDQGQDSYLGFYPAERWKGMGIYRWSGSGAIINLPRAEVFELTFVCSAPDLAEDPLVLSVHENNREIDKIYFFRQESITRRYYLPEAGVSGRKLYFHVSRTWNLKKLGVANDARNLGVAVSKVRVLKEIPAGGIGFYDRETWEAGDLPGFQYRWTNRSAVFLPQELNREQNLYIRAGQPGLPDNPLQVDILQEGRVIGSLRLADTAWHPAGPLNITDMSAPVTIRVARTWNPRAEGVGQDTRSLGVAVAGLAGEKLPAMPGHN